MRVLVIGSGGREHALIARLATDRNAGELLCAPGNPGIARLARICDVDVTDLEGLLALADRDSVDFTIVGPELPLSLGIVDRFAAAGRLIFGPTASAARLEASKAFAKALMARHGVPTARSQTCESMADALDLIASNTFGWPVVLKADGLAAGKGVVVAADRAAAESAIRAAMQEHRFGTAGARLVIEEFLNGQEVSFFVVSDGSHAVPIGTAHDHKRIFDDDRGPNTGGMGAFAPSPLVDPETEARIMRDIVQPVIGGMAADGCEYRGFLYVGLMLTAAGPQVIEFNARMGDPEAQVIAPLIAEPLLPLLGAAAAGALKQSTVRMTGDRCAGVVIASRGYPESAESGQTINGVERAEAMPGVVVYHAGTAKRDGRLVTSGGRVLTVVGRGDDFPEAISRAYAGVQQISFDGMQYRRDIGNKVLRSWDPRTFQEPVTTKDTKDTKDTKVQS
jgi:phosphoribosylamine---glycine ligase